MKSKRSRLALVGVLALAISVTVGLVSGSVADAKKKKKSSKTVTVSKTGPIAVPMATTGPSGVDGHVDVPLIVGKKAKGKRVALDTLTVTTSWTSAANGDLNPLSAELIAPNGRTVGLNAPFFDNQVANQGPTFETPNTSQTVCTATTPPCSGVDQTLVRPYAGPDKNVALLAFDGVSAKGTWILRLSNFSSTVTGNLASVTLQMSLMNPLP
jgi:hypothetical protein